MRFVLLSLFVSFIFYSLFLANKHCTHTQELQRESAHAAARGRYPARRRTARTKRLPNHLLRSPLQRSQHPIHRSQRVHADSLLNAALLDGGMAATAATASGVASEPADGGSNPSGRSGDGTAAAAAGGSRPAENKSKGCVLL